MSQKWNRVRTFFVDQALLILQRQRDSTKDALAITSRCEPLPTSATLLMIADQNSVLWACTVSDPSLTPTPFFERLAARREGDAPRVELTRRK